MNPTHIGDEIIENADYFQIGKIWPNPPILHKCKQLRPAIGQSMPQPAHTGDGSWYDVEIHIFIWPDGRVHESSVLPRGRPELEKEAVRLVQSWQFALAACEDRPVPHSANLTIHFPPQ